MYIHVYIYIYIYHIAIAIAIYLFEATLRDDCRSCGRRGCSFLTMQLR